MISSQRIADIVLMDGTADSFKIYDDAYLHIGFRVHAHIYNLSQRKRTILIEEDDRGAGVNEALGLPSLLAYNDELQIADINLRRVVNKLKAKTNDNLLEQLYVYIDMIENNGDIYYENAFRLMESYYKIMCDFIEM